MKLPRYLQLAIAVTVGLVIWSQFVSDEDPDELTLSPSTAQRTRPAATTTPATKPDSASWVNLFPGPVKADKNAPGQSGASAPPPPPPPSAPPLPLQVMGAWWSQQQRIVIITDGNQTWPVCKRCQADGKIWIGSSPVAGWSLVDVANDHLLFEWQATHTRKRLELDDLQAEPTR
jgi:hypothetical protein